MSRSRSLALQASVFLRSELAKHVIPEQHPSGRQAVARRHERPAAENAGGRGSRGSSELTNEHP